MRTDICILSKIKKLTVMIDTHVTKIIFEQDHLDIHLTFLDKTHTSMSFRLSYLWRAIVGLFNYVIRKRGELTSNYTQAVGFTKSQPNLPAPDL